MNSDSNAKKIVFNPETVSGGKKVYENVLYIIEEADFSIKDSSVEFVNCIFKSENSERKIDIEKTKAVFKHCNFFIPLNVGFSNCLFDECRFEQISSTALFVENSSTIHIENCLFYKNGTEDVLGSQIIVSDSAFYAKNITVKDGINAFGVEGFNSSLHLDKAEILLNEGCGISFKFCRFEISRSIIKNNGSGDNDFTQVMIEGSKGSVSDTKIEEGLNSNGIVVTDKSGVDIVRSKVCSHIKNGIAAERSSNISIKNCQIEKNGDEYEETLQIWVDNSTLFLSDCLIQDGVCGVYAQKNSYVTVSLTQIKNNLGAVCVFESSKLDMRDCLIEMTFEKIPVWTEESYAVFKNLTFTNNEHQKVVYMDSMTYVDMQNVRLDKNCRDALTIKNSKNVHTELKCLSDG